MISFEKVFNNNKKKEYSSDTSLFNHIIIEAVMGKVFSLRELVITSAFTLEIFISVFAGYK